MKKISLTLAGLIAMISVSFAQPVADRAVVPVAVTLNQILRMNIIDGGHIEFVFNTIDDYETGLSNAAQYDTRFNVAASMPWRMNIYAEQATFIGTDDPTLTMSLDHVGFQVAADGNHQFANELVDVNTYNAATSALVNAAATTVIGSTSSFGGNSLNTGDVDDNLFTVNWEVGTGAGNTNQTSLIDMGYMADRYVTNVIFELATSSDL